MIKTAIVYLATTSCEIAGCFSFRAWIRDGKSALVDRAGHRLADALCVAIDSDRYGCCTPPVAYAAWKQYMTSGSRMRIATMKEIKLNEAAATLSAEVDRS
jgi:hypothetical protein